eukprot:3836506-Rhodomonas_salina.1
MQARGRLETSEIRARNSWNLGRKQALCAVQARLWREQGSGDSIQLLYGSSRMVIWLGMGIGVG